MRTTSLLIILLVLFQQSHATTFHIGIGQPYPFLVDAAAEAMPGDTLLVYEGVYQGGLFIADLQGTAEDPIYILNAPGETVIYSGGTNAWQFSDAAYLHISGFTFQEQTGNGLNFDDGGTYETPAHHLTFENCTFQNINATGNNDLFKMSGIDHFEIRNCVFMNGSPGGSGIDMVGCHEGLITGCHFENLGSNSIQAKGGTSRIRIERNFFKNGGLRALNLGGSTGLQFFRPLDAPYEAAELFVYSNIFIGSDAPIAFVGSIDCEVVNNTIYLPTRWVLRILQETVDPERFPPCGNNTFRNNILYINDQVNVECNIGPNTAPETFTFSNNLWYHAEDSNWPGPDLPVTDDDNLVGEDPLFEDASIENFELLPESPAIGNGFNVADPLLDFNLNPFLSTRSIGAYEGGVITGVTRFDSERNLNFSVFPNPIADLINIKSEIPLEDCLISLISLDGKHLLLQDQVFSSHEMTTQIPVDPRWHGVYILTIERKNFSGSQLIYIP